MDFSDGINSSSAVFLGMQRRRDVVEQQFPAGLTDKIFQPCRRFDRRAKIPEMATNWPVRRAAWPRSGLDCALLAPQPSPDLGHGGRPATGSMAMPRG